MTNAQQKYVGFHISLTLELMAETKALTWLRLEYESPGNFQLVNFRTSGISSQIQLTVNLTVVLPSNRNQLEIVLAHARITRVITERNHRVWRRLVGFRPPAAESRIGDIRRLAMVAIRMAATPLPASCVQYETGIFTSSFRV